MKTFNEQFDSLNEMVKLDNELDLEFLRRAEVVNSFNLQSSDFTSTKNKAEIQYIFTKNWFPTFDLAKCLKDMNVNGLNALISELKSISLENFMRLHTYPLRGVGPGEATLYYLIDTAYLGGGSSAGKDIIVGEEEIDTVFVNGKGYEIKAVSLTGEGYYNNFKLGGTVNLSPLIHNAVKIAKSIGLEFNGTEINKTMIKAIKASEKAKDWEELVEKPYVPIAAKYFEGHDTIFILNTGTKDVIGTVSSIKRIKESDIELDVITSGTMKPKIRK